MLDIEGNILEIGMNVYILAALNPGSKSMRLLYGTITNIKGGAATVLVAENKREYTKRSSTIVRPME